MDIWFIKNKAPFYAQEVIALLYKISSEIESKKNDTAFEDSEVRALANEFFNFLTSKVSELKTDLKYRDPEFIEFFQLAMVAIVDDVFLTLAWSGRSLWSTVLLELRFFSTRASGDTFFENCKAILSQRDQKHRELAEIYHLCIVAGFRGKYSGIEYSEEINAVKASLYDFFTEGAPNSREFFAQANLLSGPAQNASQIELMKKFKLFNRLILTNVVIITAFIIASCFVWFYNENIIFRNL